jgi:hypothetical protein
MKVNLLRVNRFFMQDEKKKCKSQFAFPIHSSVSSIPNFYRVAPKSLPRQNHIVSHPLEALQWPTVDL